MAYFINNKCNKCGACVSECPTQAIFEIKKQYIIDSDSCDDHQACVAVCPVNAIHLLPALSASSPQNEEE